MQHSHVHHLMSTLTILLAICTACGDTRVPSMSSDDSKSDDLSSICQKYSSPVVVAQVQENRAKELSGLVLSRKNPNLLWSHNDGNIKNVFGIQRDGTTARTLTLPELALHDIEDIAIGHGPLPDLDYIYLADTGDNGNERKEIQVIRFPEPLLQDKSTPVKVEVFRFRYDDDDPHDAEAIVVDPISKQIVIITKHGPEERRTRVYTSTNSFNTEKINPLAEVLRDTQAPHLKGSVVAADITPDGLHIALLFKEEGVRIWVRNKDESIASALTRAPCEAPIAVGQQESLALSPDGNSFYLVPEGLEPTLSFVRGSIQCPTIHAKPPTSPISVSTSVKATGITHSQRYENLIWVASKSKADENRTTILALSPSGDELATWEFPQLENVHWEDLAIGPGPSLHSYLYIADIGDKDRLRPTITVHRVAESEFASTNAAFVESFEFRYPKHASYDAESILIDPLTGDLYIITRKRGVESKTRVYRATAPFMSGDTIKLKKVLDEDDSPGLRGTIVGADVSSDGLHIALARKNDAPLLFTRSPEGPLFEALRYPACFGIQAPGKHESITFNKTGTKLFQLSTDNPPQLFVTELRY